MGTGGCIRAGDGVGAAGFNGDSVGGEGTLGVTCAGLVAGEDHAGGALGGTAARLVERG